MIHITTMRLLIPVIVSLYLTYCGAEYACVCSYSVERKVYSTADMTSSVQGYMYEFDCKQVVFAPELDTKQFFAVAYHHKLGYVAVDNNLQYQTCPGDPSTADLIPPTTVTTTVMSTTSTEKTSVKHSTHMLTTPPTDPVSTSPLKTTTMSKTTVPTPSKPTTVSTVPSTTTSATTLTTTTTTPTTTPITATTTSTTTTMTTTPSTTPTTTTPTTSSTPTTTSTTPTATTTHSTTPTTTTVSTTTTPIASTTSTSTTSTTATTIATTTVKPFDTTDSPLAYIGIGYNMLKGNPSGMATNDGGSEAGLLKARRILSFTVDESIHSPREAEMKINKVCATTKQYFLLHDGHSYQNELLTFVNGENKDNYISQAFTSNTEFIQLRQKTETGAPRNVYQDLVTSCVLGNVRYKNDSANHNVGFSISHDFAKDVCGLPEIYDKGIYSQFIDTWGTSIVMSGTVGTRIVTRYKMTGHQLLLQLQDMKRTSLLSYLTPGGPYEYYGSSVIINSTMLANQRLTDMGIKLQTRQIGSQQSPAPLRLNVVPLTTALNITYWKQVLDGRLYQDVCYDNMSTGVLSNIRHNMDTALVDYTNTHSTTTKPLKAYPIQVPMTWPSGTYGLYQAASGCPASKVTWVTGFRAYDTEDSSSHNYYSSDVRAFLAGYFNANNLETRFCMKTVASLDPHYDRAWPNGTYCILRFNGCPSGFSSGFIYWDDQDIGNNNKAGGTLPDGSYGTNTRIYYCCRDDGSVSSALLMPRDRPFILLRLGPMCQVVYKMEAHEVVVRWDDEDTFNSDSVGGKHPLDDGGSKDHKLHFCYYRERLNALQPGIIG